MFKLGDYDEDDAPVIAEFLREAGIKVELKPAIDVHMRSQSYVEGKIAELKDKVQNIGEYERYLEDLRRVFPECKDEEDLFESMGTAQSPDWKANKDELKQLAALEAELMTEADNDLNIDDKGLQDLISEEGTDNDTAVELISEGDPILADSSHAIEPMESASSDDYGMEHEHEMDSLYERKKRLYEQLKQLYERREELINGFSKNVSGYVFVLRTLERNKIKFGEEVGSRLDDPVVRIVSTEDNMLTVDPESIKTLEMLEFLKTIAVYIDEFSAAMADDLDDSFKDEYEREYGRIAALSVFIRDLIFEHPDRKMDMETFVDMCAWQSDEEWGTLQVDGTSVSEDILKMLEKKGIAKIKGDWIKWKKN